MLDTACNQAKVMLGYALSVCGHKQPASEYRWGVPMASAEEPEVSSSFQPRDVYFDSETSSLHWKSKLRNGPKDCKNAILHCRDVLDVTVTATFCFLPEGW